MATFYETLGIQQDATSSEIESVYRSLVKKYHPDTNGKTGARKMFTRVRTAREVLRDEEERTLYDSVGHDVYLETCLSSEKWPDVPSSFTNNPSATEEPSTDQQQRTASQPSPAADRGNPNAEPKATQSTIGDYRTTDGGGTTATSATTTTAGTDTATGTATTAETGTGTTESEWVDDPVDDTISNQSTDPTDDSAGQEKEQEPMANGGAHSDPVEDITDTASVDEQTEEFWETEAATVGGDEMGGATPSENEEDPSRTTQQPRRQQNGIAQNSPDQQHNNDRFFQPSTIAAIYVFLNIAAILSGWSFYASNVPQPSVIGALKSPLMLSIVGIVFFVSATHFVFRRM